MQRKQQYILPKNWRQQVSQMLAQQGFEANEQKVYDVLRGRYIDAELLKMVKRARAKVAARYARQLRSLQAIKAIFFLLFWLF